MFTGGLCSQLEKKKKRVFPGYGYPQGITHCTGLCPDFTLQSKTFCTKCHFQSCGLGGKSIFIKNSWPQWSDNAAFWYQQMFCLTCSLKLYSVPSYLSFPVAICWRWDVMYVPYSYARQFASNTSARNELHETLVAITPHFPNHMEHNTLKPIDTFFFITVQILKT